MKLLLHCICRQAPVYPLPGPGIFLAAVHGLAAVLSQVEEADSLPGLASLLAFEQVVEAIHATQAVIPMRYGCLMEGEEAVIRLLENSRQAYDALLDRLDGMTEMGIRVLCPASLPTVPPISLSPGSAYLASLRERYPAGVSLAAQETQLADRIAASLTGCYTEQRSEITQADQGRMLSLYFLTPKGCIEDFRSRVREIDLDGVRLLMSGPWPPYNFVSLSG